MTDNKKKLKTNEEINDLKQQWLSDSIWDIEETEGFEEHREELKEFRLQQEKIYKLLFK